MEDGFTRISNELLVAMARARLKSTEYPIVLLIARETYGWNVKHKVIRVDFMARELGMAPTKVSEAVAELLRRNVLYRVGDSQGPLGINKHYDQWLKKNSASKTVNRGDPKTGMVHEKREEIVHEKRESNKERKDMNTPSNEGERIGEPKREASGDEKPKAKGDSLPDCPHMEIIDLWAEVMPDKPQPAKNLWQGTERARHLAARWKAGFSIKHERTGKPLYTTREEGIEWWGRFFKFLRKSPFLMGDNRWFKLAWVVKRENFVKIMELSYHEEITQ